MSVLMYFEYCAFDMQREDYSYAIIPVEIHTAARLLTGEIPTEIFILLDFIALIQGYDTVFHDPSKLNFEIYNDGSNLSKEDIIRMAEEE